MSSRMLHARAQRHRRAATMRHVHRIKRSKRNRRHNIRNPNRGRGGVVLEGDRTEKPRQADTVTRDATGGDAVYLIVAQPVSRIIDTIPPVEAEDYPWALAAAAQGDVPPAGPGSSQTGYEARR